MIGNNLIPESPKTSVKNKVGDTSFIDENDIDVPYTELPRNYGDGEIRIGTFLSLNDDIYSLGFASLATNELIDTAILKEDAVRPTSNYMPAKTPKGSFVLP